MPWSVVVREGKPKLGKKGKGDKGGGKKPHNISMGKGGHDVFSASPSAQSTWQAQPLPMRLPTTPSSPAQGGLPASGSALVDTQLGPAGLPNHSKQVRKDAGGAIESLKKILATVAGASLWEGKDTLLAMLEAEIAAHKQAIIESKPPAAQLAGATELKTRLEAKLATLRLQWAELGKQKQLAVAEWDAKLQKKLDDINIIGASIATCKARVIQLTQHVALAEGAQCITTQPVLPFNFGGQRQDTAAPPGACPQPSPNSPPPVQDDPYRHVKVGISCQDVQMMGSLADVELHYAAMQQQQRMMSYGQGFPSSSAVNAHPLPIPAHFIIAEDEELGCLLQEAALTLDAAGVAPSDQQVAFALHAALAAAALPAQEQNISPLPPVQANAVLLNHAIAQSVSSGSLSPDDAKQQRGRSRSKDHAHGRPFRKPSVSRGRRALSLSHPAASGK